MTQWMTEAKKHIGLKEISGKQTNLTIKSWLSNLRAWWSDDETPWCGTFVAHCVKSSGYKLPKHWYRAKDWLNWGVEITNPCYGCVVVFERKGGGHVGFVCGMDHNRRLLVLGGNQNNEVNVTPFDRTRVLGYRLPDLTVVQKQLPIITTSISSSENEA